MQDVKLIGWVNNNYFPDVLGNGFNKLTLSLTDDYEGEVVATLIRRESETQTGQAILYVHGFNDYFFRKKWPKNLINMAIISTRWIYENTDVHT